MTIQTKKEALLHCELCQKYFKGCAETCEIRIKLKIPPHGDSYLD